MSGKTFDKRKPSSLCEHIDPQIKDELIEIDSTDSETDLDSIEIERDSTNTIMTTGMTATEFLTWPDTAQKLRQGIKTESSQAVTSKILGHKQFQKDKTKYAEEIEILSANLKRAYISEGVPAAVAETYCTNTVVRAPSTNASSDRAKLIIEADIHLEAEEIIIMDEIDVFSMTVIITIFVPHQWESEGMLYWPLSNLNLLRKDACSEPDKSSWRTYKCKVKKEKIVGLEEAELWEEEFVNVDTDAENSQERVFDCMKSEFLQARATYDRVYELLKPKQCTVTDTDALNKDEETLSERFQFPLATVEEVLRFNTDINQDETFKNYLLKRYCAIGGVAGNEEGRTIARKLRHIFFT
nr:unnamed protein product [Callosobruchus chinensis]